MTDKRPRVLIVDDEEAVLAAFERGLEDEFEVTVATNGADAIACLEAVGPFDLVMADQRMPQMTGTEVLAHVLTHAPETGRVLFTASDLVDDVRDAVNVAQIHRFLLKPLRFPEMKQTIRDVLLTLRLESENRRLLLALEMKNRALEEALARVRAHEASLEEEVNRRTTALRNINAELQQLALRDGLTGLYNHRYFQEALSAAVARARRYKEPLALLFLDVDHFKAYNDTHGHPAGDELLRHLARYLTPGQACEGVLPARESDVAARYGGEEFVVILPLTDKSGALTRAERLRSAIAAHPFPGGETQPLGKITVSIGVAAYPYDAGDKRSLVEAADRALLEAKQAGRNRVEGAQVELKVAHRVG